jgi:hypothetical protein
MDAEQHELQRIQITAVIAALVEGVRMLGPKGTNEYALYSSIATLMDRKAFDMIVTELIEQKTFKRDGNRLTYCGPCMIGENE